MGLTREEKLRNIKEYVQSDLLAADLKLSLFISAAKSFKKDFLVNPYPNFKPFLTEDGKDFDRLLEDINQIPSIEELLVILMANLDKNLMGDSVVDLLHWILIEYLKYDCVTVAKDEHQRILSLSKSIGRYQPPLQIFKINYRDSSAAEKKFNQLKVGTSQKWAYHGTKAFNIYTICNYGLQQHLNKISLFGEGLYFSNEVQVSLLFSNSVTSWNKSKLGEMISCVAICEYIDDQNYVKIRKENAKNSDIPSHYILITNNEIVRVRYLMIYGSKKPLIKQTLSSGSLKATEIEEESTINCRSVFAWCRRNPLVVSIFLYFLLLTLVGFSNHRSFEHFKRIALDFLKRRFKFE